MVGRRVLLGAAGGGATPHDGRAALREDVRGGNHRSEEFVYCAAFSLIASRAASSALSDTSTEALAAGTGGALPGAGASGLAGITMLSSLVALGHC